MSSTFPICLSVFLANSLLTKPVFQTVQRLLAELRQRFAIRSVNCFTSSIYDTTGNFYKKRARFSRFLRAMWRARGSDCRLNGNRPANKPSTCTCMRSIEKLCNFSSLSISSPQRADVFFLSYSCYTEN